MQTIHTDDNVLDGHPDIVAARRSALKLATTPRIFVAIPVGGKALTSILECPNCENTYQVNEGFTVPHMVPLPFMLSHMNWVPPLNVSMSYAIKSGVRSPVARQIMTMEAIRQGAEYIFYVDDDTLVPPLGLYTLYNFMERNPHAGAVTGVYTTRETPNEPLIYKEHGKGCAWDFEMGPDAQPELIFGSGAGCLLARVSAIVAWMDAHPDTPIWADQRDLPDANEEGRVIWGHDIRFCRELNLAGWPVYVDGRVLCGHYDVRTGKIFEVPPDAPGFRKRPNINTEAYWDQVYGLEGADTWRKYSKMHAKLLSVIAEAPDVRHVVEFGCGVGILGQRIVGKFPVHYTGYDMSQTAVDMCQARCLEVEKLDLCHLGEHVANPNIVGATDVILSEVLEHLDEDVMHTTLELLRTLPNLRRLYVTVPDNCMPPEEVPEHQRVFAVDSITALLRSAGWDDICVWEKDEVDNAHLIAYARR